MMYRMSGGGGADWEIVQVGIAIVAKRVGNRDACGRDYGGTVL